MLTNLIVGIVLLTLGPGGIRAAPQAPEGPEWLMQMAGEWETEAELTVDPSSKPIKAKGTSSARSLGGLWIIAEMKTDFMGTSIIGISTVGYDKSKKKYVGTFIASVHDYLWQYTGSVDSTGKILTLNAEGPSPLSPGKLFKYKDVYEIKSKDHKIMTSSIQTEDGKWTTFATVHFRRKK